MTINGRNLFLKGIFPALALILLAYAVMKFTVQPSDTDPVKIDPALAVLVPPETQMLVGIRAKEITKTPVYELLREERLLEPLESFVERTGITPEKQLYELLITFDGEESLILARAKFHEESALEPDIKGPGMARFDHGGRMFIGNPQYAIAFVNATTAIMGNTPYLRRTVDRLNAGQLGMPEEFRQRQQDIPRTHYLWMITRGLTPEMRGYIPQEGNAANLSRLLDGMQSSHVMVDLRGDVSISASAAMQTQQAAEQIVSALRGLAGLARLTTPKDQLDLLTVYDSLQAEATGTRVDASLRIQQSQLPVLLDLLR
ncbi:MAG: hypothetical protein MUF01_15990 [Bryobacterales bacterium]|jgi:hypothetical protein|nr:hypothetical protein [Bryobacterales bacterium]